MLLFLMPPVFRFWAEEMAQCIKAFEAKADDLNLIPRCHMVEKENKLLKVILSSPT